MTDRKERPDMLVPDKRIVSMDEARDERHQRRAPGEWMKSYVTREEMMAHLPKAALAIGQKMYDQVSEELAGNFEEQERRLVALIQREFERRSLRGRVRGWWHRVAGTPAPALVVDPVDALDPNVHAAATSEDLDEGLYDELEESQS